MLSNTHIHIHILSLAHTQTDGYSKLPLVLILLFVFGEYFLSLPRYAKYARLAQFSHRFSWLAAHIFYDILRFSMCFFFVCYVVRVFREVGIIELSARLAARQKYGVAASASASAAAAARSVVFCLLFACN